MDNPQVIYRSASPNVVSPVGNLRRKFPLPIQSLQRLAAYAFDVELSCLLDASQNNAGGNATIFPPIALNSLASNAGFNFTGTSEDSSAILTNYSQPKDDGGGLGSFTGTFTIAPASWDEYQTQDWTPPGWIGTFTGAATYTARNELPIEATVRLHHDYFIVDQNSIIAGAKDSSGTAIIAASGGDSLLNGNTAAKTVTDAGKIPSLFKTYFCNTLINTNPVQPVYPSHVNSLTPAGGILGYAETFPNIAAYQIWCANVLTIQKGGGDPWAGLVWDGGAAGAPYLDQNQSQITQIILKDSILKPYAGNIWERITTYALTV